MVRKTGEPSAEPVADQWYPLTLGSSCSDHASTKFYSLRYEFKPASIDLARPGSLHNSADNKVTVEFMNNLPGKPKVAFQGNSEDCKDLDAVIFFDGNEFRLERLHKAVKSLRHVRQPGEFATAGGGGNSLAKENDPLSSPRDGNNIGMGAASSQGVEKPQKKAGVAAVREPIVAEEIVSTKPDPPVGKKKAGKKGSGVKAKVGKGKKSNPAPSVSPADKKRKREPSPTHVDVDIEDDGEDAPLEKAEFVEDAEQIDVVVDEEIVEEHESDYEIEDIDVSEDEDGEKAEPDTTMQAQAAAGATEEAGQSQSSSSSGSGSSESGSGSSSSDSGSEDESGSSGDDGDDM